MDAERIWEVLNYILPAREARRHKHGPYGEIGRASELTQEIQDMAKRTGQEVPAPFEITPKKI